ncbi:acyl-CoA dehydrogenase family protein [Streptomyces sp. NPDC091292]|uniref:acyl-CoA dehydrogenase family protein n=1 Tax=Streptomyces sp. NPDC091292 TaxID=3365991 RepID=UPI0038031DEA
MTINRELWETVRAVLADHPADVDKGWPTELWSTLADLGLVRLSLPERAGGSGGELADVATVLLAAGEAAAPVPLAETELAVWLLHTAGQDVPTGPLAVAAAEPASTILRTTPAGAVVTGVLPRVGWARHATHVVLLMVDQDGVERVVTVEIDPSRLRYGTNLAGEPRDELALDTEVGREVGAVAEAPPGTRELLARRAAMYRAVLLAGAAERALALSVRHAGERTQFGRQIGGFQAIQQQLALAAGEVAAGRAAAEAAVRVAARTDFGGGDAEFAIACAKARTSEAAGVVARVAHQVLGAIGFTLEHPLRLATTRLWAWREEDGSDAYWNAVIGRRVLAEGADGLWPLLTGGGSAHR